MLDELERAKEVSFRQPLEKNVMEMKMQIRRDVPGDGNCFFSCVQDQLDRLGLPAPSTVGSTRSTCAKYSWID